MARGVGRLNAMSGKRDLAPGLHHDGHGLYLQVSGKRARSWVLRYTLRGTARVMGLGPATYITLAEARQRTHEAHRLLLDGIDPSTATRNGPPWGSPRPG
jgi:hypothetical protein